MKRLDYSLSGMLKQSLFSPTRANDREHRVLVVDDNLDYARSFASIVAGIGHKAEYALNGYVALDLMNKFRPDVVFMDLTMPGMDGFEVARRLKTAFGNAIHIIAVTGRGTEQDRERSAKAGCELHLLKPVDPIVIETILASFRGFNQQ